MLDRYRKPGGFLQLLRLLETCGAAKQEKFLKIVREQDVAWAQALEVRILTIARIFTWREDALVDLLPSLPDSSIAIALHGLNDQQREIYQRLLTFAQKRNTQDLFETNHPTPAEVTAVFEKILIKARQLIVEGRVRLIEIDPGLIVPDDIEESLKRGPILTLRSVTRNESFDSDQYEPVKVANVAAVMGAATQAEAAARLEASLREENMALRRKLINLNNENGTLKQDIVRLQIRIEQIRKMAA